MCNLSDGVYQNGLEQGIAKIVLSMYKNNLSLEQISEISDLPFDAVQKIIENAV